MISSFVVDRKQGSVVKDEENGTYTISFPKVLHLPNGLCTLARLIGLSGATDDDDDDDAKALAPLEPPPTQSRVQTKTISFRLPLPNESHTELIKTWADKLGAVNVSEPQQGCYEIEMEDRHDSKRGFASLQQAIGLDQTPVEWEYEHKCRFHSVSVATDRQEELFEQLAREELTLERPVCVTAKDRPINKNKTNVSSSSPPPISFAKKYEAWFCRQDNRHDCALDNFADQVAEMGNDNRYELLRENKPCRLFMDVEWLSDQVAGDGPTVLKTLCDLWAEFQGGGVSGDNVRLQILDSSRPAKKGGGVRKMSYHLVFPDVYFANVNHKMRRYVRSFIAWLAAESYTRPEADGLSFVDKAHKRRTKAMCKFVVDGGVYTKNRLIRMVGQSKVGSDSVLTVMRGQTIWGMPFDGLCLLQVDKLPTKSRYVKHACFEDDTDKSANHHGDDDDVSAHPVSKRHRTLYPGLMINRPIRMPIVPDETFKARFTDVDDVLDKETTVADTDITLNHPRDILLHIDAASLRHDNFLTYWSVLCSLAKGDDPAIQAEDIVEWVNRSSGPERSMSDCASAATKRQEVTGSYQNALRYLRAHYRSVTCWFRQKDDEPTCAEKNHNAWNTLWRDAWPVATQDDFLSHVHRAHSQRPWDSENGTAIHVRGEMGSGKTYAMLEAVHRMKYRRVLYVVGRRLLVDEIARRAREMATNDDSPLAVFTYNDKDVFEKEVLASHDEERGILPSSSSSDDGGDYSDDDDDDDDDTMSIREDNGEDNFTPRLFITCINSIRAVPENVFFDMVIVDEAETTVANLYSRDLVGTHGREIGAVFGNICTKTALLVTVDAEHTDPLADTFWNAYWKVWYNRACGDDDDDEKPERVQMTLTATRNDAEERRAIYTESVCCAPQILPFGVQSSPSSSSSHFRTNKTQSIGFEILKRVLVWEERVCICVPYRYMACQLRDLLTTTYPDGKVVRVQMITGEEPVPRDKTINQLALSCDVLIYTSSLSAGHSIEVGEHFSVMFAVFSFDMGANATQTCSTLTEQVQMVARLRSTREQKLYYAVSLRTNNNNGYKSSASAGEECPTNMFATHFCELVHNRSQLRQGSYSDVYRYIRRSLHRAFPALTIRSQRTTVKVDAATILDKCLMPDREIFARKRKANKDVFEAIANKCSRTTTTTMVHMPRPSFSRSVKSFSAKYINFCDDNTALMEVGRVVGTKARFVPTRDKNNSEGMLVGSDV